MSSLYPRDIPPWARSLFLLLVAAFGAYGAGTIVGLVIAVRENAPVVIVEPHLFSPLLLGVPLGLVTLAAHSTGDRAARRLIGIGGFAAIAVAGIPIEISLEQSTSAYLRGNAYARCAVLDQVRHERHGISFARAWARPGDCRG